MSTPKWQIFDIKLRSILVTIIQHHAVAKQWWDFCRSQRILKAGVEKKKILGSKIDHTPSFFS
jgi:hypothetical protein